MHLNFKFVNKTACQVGVVFRFFDDLIIFLSLSDMFPLVASSLLPIVANKYLCLAQDFMLFELFEWKSVLEQQKLINSAKLYIYFTVFLSFSYYLF